MRIEKTADKVSKGASKLSVAASIAGLAILFVFAMAVLAGVAKGEEAQHAVRNSWVCNLEGITALRETALKGNDPSAAPAKLGGLFESGDCVSLGNFYNMRVLAKVGFSFTDADGDAAYVVRVGDLGGLSYTFAWPGYNSNIPKPISFHI